MGEWIPEPLPEPAEWVTGRPGSTTIDPADRVTLDESVSMAFLVVLESIIPAERVAFILHDVFRYSFAEIAGIVGRTPAACRQLASSARRRIRAAQAPPAPAARQVGIVRAFKVAWEAKDIDALIGLLDPDATAIADGGGLATTFLHPIEGRERIARAWVEIANRAPGNMTFLERTVNGQLGLMAQQDALTVTVFAFDVAGELQQEGHHPGTQPPAAHQGRSARTATVVAPAYFRRSHISAAGPPVSAGQRAGGWARWVQGIVPARLAAISVRSAGSQVRTVPAWVNAIRAVMAAGLGATTCGWSSSVTIMTSNRP
jgi:hypothetical protein